MLPRDINAGCSELFDAWCERRAARPLRHLLQAWPLANGLTDEWGDLYEALRALQADCRTEIFEAEREKVDEMIRAIATNVLQR